MVLGLIVALGVTAVPATAQDALICRKRDKQGDKSGDKHFLGRGNDYFNGGDGRDRIYGGPGDDILNGGRGNDKVYGGPGNDIVCGGIDNDKVFGDGGTRRGLRRGGQRLRSRAAPTTTTSSARPTATG